MSGTILQSDETGLRVGKRNWWLWVFHHDDSAVFVVEPSQFRHRQPGNKFCKRTEHPHRRHCQPRQLPVLESILRKVIIAIQRAHVHASEAGGQPIGGIVTI
jgi:hypothetical protein